jgi:general secretion pathway protein N
MIRIGTILLLALGGAALAGSVGVRAASNTGVEPDWRDSPGGPPFNLGTRMSDVAKAPEARPGNPLWAVPLSSLTLTRQRPLFSASRRPPTPPAIAAPPVVQARPAPPPRPRDPEKPRLSLVGTVGGEDGIAVFVDQTTQSIVRLRPGEGHQGWILRAVGGREVTMQNNRDTAILALPRPDGR